MTNTKENKTNDYRNWFENGDMPCDKNDYKNWFENVDICRKQNRMYSNWFENGDMPCDKNEILKLIQKRKNS